MKVAHPITGVWQKWRFSAPQTHLWLIKHWFSASSFVVKIATFAKLQTVCDLNQSVKAERMLYKRWKPFRDDKTKAEAERTEQRNHYH